MSWGLLPWVLVTTVSELLVRVNSSTYVHVCATCSPCCVSVCFTCLGWLGMQGWLWICWRGFRISVPPRLAFMSVTFFRASSMVFWLYSSLLLPWIYHLIITSVQALTPKTQPNVFHWVTWGRDLREDVLISWPKTVDVEIAAHW